MVNMSYQVSPNSSSIRDTVMQLIEKRTQMESELKSHLEVLEANKANMTDNLVDSEGFPRSDIDVYQVRHARHRIIYLKNDLKSVMAEIEEKLHHLHSIEGGTSTEQATALPMLPIACIGNVVIKSPAEKAGIVKDDAILEFGEINSRNFKSLLDFAAVVKSSVNKDIPIIVLRGDTKIRLFLKPQPFDGQGLVGCYFQNYEHVELER